MCNFFSGFACGYLASAPVRTFGTMVLASRFRYGLGYGGLGFCGLGFGGFGFGGFGFGGFGFGGFGFGGFGRLGLGGLSYWC